MNSFSQITFPKSERDDIKTRLAENKIVYTIRVSNEYGRYKEDDILITEWGSKVQILSVKEVSGGIKELEKEYPYFGQLTDEMIRELTPFKDLEIVSLKMI